MSEEITPHESKLQPMPAIMSEAAEQSQENNFENKNHQDLEEGKVETNLKDMGNSAMESSGSEQDSDSKWYILQSYAGQEKKAYELIRFHTQMEKMEKLVDEIFIPSEEITTKVKGKERKSTSTYYPGYILIKMKLTDAMWHLLQKIPKVSGFIGKYRDHRPESVPDSQIHNIKLQDLQEVKDWLLLPQFAI